MQLTRSSSLSKFPKKTLYSSIIPNTQTVIHRKVPSGEIRLPQNPDHKRDMRNEVPIKTLVYRNENMDTVARNYSKRDEGDENFAAHFFTNSLKRFERDYSKEVREKLIDEYKKENPDAYEIAKLMLNRYIMGKLKEFQQLEKNKKTAVLRVSMKKSSDKNKVQEDNKKQKGEVKRLFNNMKKAIEHILDQEGEKKFERMEKKLAEKESLSIEMFKKKNVDIPTKLDLIGKLRLLLSKKTDEMEIYKEIESSLRLDSCSEIAKEFREYSESNLDLSIASSKVSSRLSRYTEEIKRQKEKDEEKKINKYFDLKKLKEKWKVEDNGQVQQIIRRALVRDTLKEHERLRIKGSQRIEKKKEAKVEELKKTVGISTFAISKKEVQQAKTQISLKSPLKTEKSVANLKISEKKPREFNEKGQEIFGEKQPQPVLTNLTSERTSTRQSGADQDEKKAWKKNANVKGAKETQIKLDFFKANQSQNPGTMFMRTLSYSGLFNKKSPRAFA